MSGSWRKYAQFGDDPSQDSLFNSMSEPVLVVCVSGWVSPGRIETRAGFFPSLPRQAQPLRLKRPVPFAPRLRSEAERPSKLTARF